MVDAIITPDFFDIEPADVDLTDDQLEALATLLIADSSTESHSPTRRLGQRRAELAPAA